MSRQSPTTSATEYDMYTMCKGNDGNIWCNVPVANSLRWIKICSIERGHSFFNLKIFDKIIVKNKIFMHIGELPITKYLAIGDSMTYPLTDFNAKKYHIYEYNECLVASEKKITQQTIRDETYEFYRDIGVDMGTFAYYDMGAVERYEMYIINTLKKLIKETTNNTRLKKTLTTFTKRIKTRGKLSGFMGSLMPRFGIPYDYKQMDDNGIGIFKGSEMPFSKDYIIKNAFPQNILKSKDMANEYRQTVFGENNVSVIHASNYCGDGIFPVIVNCKKTIVIQLGYTYTVIFDAISEAIRDKVSHIISDKFLVKRKK